MLTCGRDKIYKFNHFVLLSHKNLLTFGTRRIYKLRASPRSLISKFMALFSAENNVSMQTQTVDKLFKSWDDYFFSISLLSAGKRWRKVCETKKLRGTFAEPLSAQMYKLIVRLWNTKSFNIFIFFYLRETSESNFFLALRKIPICFSRLNRAKLWWNSRLNSSKTFIVFCNLKST